MYEMTFNSDATSVPIVTSNIQNDGSVIQCTISGGLAEAAKIPSNSIETSI